MAEFTFDRSGRRKASPAMAADPMPPRWFPSPEGKDFVGPDHLSPNQTGRALISKTRSGGPDSLADRLQTKTWMKNLAILLVDSASPWRKV
jgi:hypothetical protein